MNKLSKTILIIFLGSSFKNISFAQCGSPLALSSAFNMLTVIRNGTNPVAVDKTLNTVLFIHRHNSNTFGGNSGNLRYDISTNGGTSWTSNLGVLNPISNTFARYPNAAIFNPTGNTNPSNAYLSYAAATTNGTFWSSLVTGVRQLNGAGNTEAYGQPGAPSYLIAGSLVKGAPGTFWAIDAQSNGTSATGGINVFKGVWNGSNDVIWSTNTILNPPYNLTFNNGPFVNEWSIAFDPTGNFGWISLTTHLTGGPANYGYTPVFYKTINGGLSWTGPIDVNLSQFSCITSNIQGGFVPALHYSTDLAVDVYGNPHLLATVGHGDNAYSINFNMWHHLFDITQINGLWTAYDVANVNCAPAVYVGSNNSAAEQFNTPQLSRTDDGTKLFFSWTGNSNYFLNDPNTNPDLFSRGFDVTQNKWTPVKDFSSCNFSTSGRMLFPHLAEQVLEPIANLYKLAPVYAEFQSPGDPDMPVNFKFLDNATFSSTDFSIPQATLSVSILQGSTAIFCGTPMNLQLNGSFPLMQWSTGSNSSVIQINTPGVYSVAARSGCVLGSAAITVSALNMSITSSNTSICQGNTVSLTVSGNALSYTWMPGGSSGTSVTFTPAANSVYTVTGSGNGCTSSSFFNVTVNPTPTISASSGSICEGQSYTISPTGATTYTYSSGNPVVTPTLNASYTVTGASSAGCLGTTTLNVSVSPAPPISLAASKYTICPGEPITITASSSNAYNYVWSTTSVGATVSLTPSVTTTYTVVGINANNFNCNRTATVTITVDCEAAGLSNEPGWEERIVIFPNPSTGDLTITLPQVSENMEVELYSAAGEMLYSKPIHEETSVLNLKEYANGIYFLKVIKGDSHPIHRKIIKIE